MLRIGILTICISALMGIFYLHLLQLWFMSEALTAHLAHEYSGCPCIEQTRHGEAVLKQKPVIGKEKAHVLRILGKPVYMRDLTKEPGWRTTDSVDEIWEYLDKNVLLHFQKGRCIGAFGSTEIYH